ncbi:phytanoyl-CoA dioxygenase family protein [Sphingomonas sp. IC-56]|uniref:phytanoyl-CoA dioxygenase family protein n=1 Tax=Sphingomonas sp. IC-56 TaxID=2898529 RepID=UPI001E40E208|nr:phytanoyl-CoA dioxygenase family protein [Sphingomonas sp. IC-56]MCD2325118.1 phytanoyl-CoA dioxygenase family protein [Sphingomonas sp. IC-56]
MRQTNAEGLQLERDGAVLHRAAVAGHIAELEQLLSDYASDRAGTRIQDHPALSVVLEQAVGGRIAHHLGSAAKPVRAILFNKTADTNWSLGWHQDRTIAVRHRAVVPGFGPWTVKQGMLHVAPPFALLAGMLTVRIHLDPVDEGNAPLLIAPGSHRQQVAEADIDEVVRACGTAACLAAQGDVWIYATPILHASQAAACPRRRRVLQVDYAGAGLPGELEWLGV